jgi:hypothetical protein
MNNKISYVSKELVVSSFRVYTMKFKSEYLLSSVMQHSIARLAVTYFLEKIAASSSE